MTQQPNQPILAPNEEGVKKGLAVLHDAGQILSLIAGRAGRAEEYGLNLLDRLAKNQKCLDEIVELLLKYSATPTNTLVDDEQIDIHELNERRRHLVDEREQLDREANDYLARCGEALKEIEATRQPITQGLDLLAAAFIAPGKRLALTNKTSVTSLVLNHRTTWAKWKMAEQRRQEQIVERKRQQGLDILHVRIRVQELLRSRLAEFIDRQKARRLETFSALTLEGVAEYKGSLDTWAPAFPAQITVNGESRPTRAFLCQYETPVAPTLGNEEIAQLCREAEETFPWAEYEERYVEQMKDLRLQLLDKLPGKYQLLEEQARAKREGDELAQEALRQRQAELDRREQEKREQLRLEEERRHKLQAQHERDQAELQSAFTSSGSLQALRQEAPKVRAQVRLEILHPMAWGELMKFYLSRESAKIMAQGGQAVEELGKKSWSTLKTYAERAANGDKGEKIESAYLRYFEDIKAVTTK